MGRPTWIGPNGQKQGGVTAYAIEASTGRLTLLNARPCMGPTPAMCLVDPTDRYVLVPNYADDPLGGASFAVLRIGVDGRVGLPTDVHTIAGRNHNAGRQGGPHPHDMKFDPAGRFVFGADLGTDKVWSWHLDATSGKLIPNDIPFATIASGAGPRQMAFHPSARFAYVLGEMGASLTVFAYDAVRPAFNSVQTVSTLPPDFTGTGGNAAVVVHPSGRFVYASNRPSDRIAIFEVDETTGEAERRRFRADAGARAAELQHRPLGHGPVSGESERPHHRPVPDRPADRAPRSHRGDYSSTNTRVHPIRRRRDGVR